ncbi:hypothetical protein, partial [Streptomyces sp. NPDC056304]
LSRSDRGVITDTERPLLRALVEAELRESDDLRRTVAGQQTVIQRQAAQLAAAHDAIREAEQDAAVAHELRTLAEGAAGQRIAATQARAADAERRADAAHADLRTLRAGIRSLGGDPTTIQNLWAQLRVRTRQWREAKQRAEQAEAAIARVRALHRDAYAGTTEAGTSCAAGCGTWPCPTLTALDEPHTT